MKWVGTTRSITSDQARYNYDMQRVDGWTSAN